MTELPDLRPMTVTPPVEVAAFLGAFRPSEPNAAAFAWALGDGKALVFHDGQRAALADGLDALADDTPTLRRVWGLRPDLLGYFEKRRLWVAGVASGLRWSASVVRLAYLPPATAQPTDR